MDNRKLVIEPSQWIIDDNGKINFRYKIITDDLNIKSATSPTYSIAAPAINQIFSEIKHSIVAETSGTNKLIRLNWTLEPTYNNLKYFIFIKRPSDTAAIYNKTISEASFSYITAAANTGTYQFTVTLPSTTKTVTNYVKLFDASITI